MKAIASVWNNQNRIDERLELEARRYRLRCKEIPGFQKHFEKAFLDAVKLGPAHVEKISQTVMEKMNARDPAKGPGTRSLWE